MLNKLFLYRSFIPLVIVFTLSSMIMSNWMYEVGPLEWLPFQKKVLQQVFQTPSVCESPEELSSFQRKQCEQLQVQRRNQLMTFVFPLLAILVITSLWWRKIRDLNRRYRRKEKKKNKKSAGLGSVVKVFHPVTRRDVFAWLFLLQGLEVSLTDQKGNTIHQVVYLPVEEPQPLVNSKVEVFSLGRHLGKKRYFARLYAPHLAVVRGV